MKCRIAIIINSINGLYLFRRELIETLLKNNDVMIIAPDGPRKDYFEKLGCLVIETPINEHGTNPITELGLLLKYKNILKENSPDIVFTYTIKPNVYAGIACAILGIPHVANITGLGTAVENKGLLQIITLGLYKLGLRKSQRVFFQNYQSKEFLIKNRVVKPDICELIPGSGVNLTHFQVLEYPNKDTIEFAFISRIMREKGIEEYLTMAKYIREKYPNTKFHVCGGASGEYERELKKLNDKGVIIYHGIISDVREIHKISSCTILPSFYPEGISNVLLESAACGRPLITTDRAGCRETVCDGVTGLLVKQKDADDLIRKVEIFMMMNFEKRRQMGLAGRKKVEQEFDRNIVINKYLVEVQGVKKNELQGYCEKP